MTTRKKKTSHLFDENKEFSSAKVSLTNHQKRTVYYRFGDMFRNIVNKTPINLNENAVLDGHVVMQKYAGDRVFPDKKSNINTLICNENTPGIVHRVSCYPDSVIVEIRDAFNEKNPHVFITNEDSDIKGILAELKSNLGYREDAFLQVLPKDLELLYRYRYFAETKFLDQTRCDPLDVDYESKYTAGRQYETHLLRLEEKYPNYVNITYHLGGEGNRQKYTSKYLSTYYNDKYTQLFKNEYEKIAHDDKAMFLIHATFTHIYLIILLQYFLKMDKIDHISIMLSYTGHAQAIYINKTGSGHYMFYNSNGYTKYPLNASINKDVLTLLRLTYPDIRTYINGQHQYKMPLCAVFAMTFVESMLDPNKSVEEKFRNAEMYEDKDDFIKKNQFTQLNRHIDSLQVMHNVFQVVEDKDSNGSRLLDRSKMVHRSQLRAKAYYYVICENQNMDGFYQFRSYGGDDYSLLFYLHDTSYVVKYTDHIMIFKHEAEDDMYLPSHRNSTTISDERLIIGMLYYVDERDYRMQFLRHDVDGTKIFLDDQEKIIVGKNAIIRYKIPAATKKTLRSDVDVDVAHKRTRRKLNRPH